MDSNENDKPNGFKFSTGDKLELELNGITKQLIIRKRATNGFVVSPNRSGVGGIFCIFCQLTLFSRVPSIN